MNENSQDLIKRPKSVLWAGVLFWLMSLGILALHIYFVTIGIVV